MSAASLACRSTLGTQEQIVTKGSGRGGRPRSAIQVGLRAHAGTWPHPAARRAPDRRGAPCPRLLPRAPPTSRPAPRPPPSPERGPRPAAAATAAAACGRVGEGPRSPHPTGRENKAAAAAALTFSVLLRAPRGDYLLRQARPVVRNSAPASVWSRMRRQLGFTRLAGSRPPLAPLPPPPSPLLPACPLSSLYPLPLHPFPLPVPS